MTMARSDGAEAAAAMRPSRRLPGMLKVGLVLCGVWVIGAIVASTSVGGDPTALHLLDALHPPSWQHPFGTDNLGRDVLTRIFKGLAVDMQIGLFSVLPAFTIGSLVGALAGYYGGWIDLALMRLVDIVVAFPFFVLVIAIVAALGPGLRNMYVAIALVGWVSYARIIRAEMLVARQLDYVSAARLLGFSDARILFRHLAPNVIGQAIIYGSSDFVLGILLGSSLSFLGLGVQPPTPEWGIMIAEGYSYIFKAPWISTFPGLFIIAVAISFSFFGDGLAQYLGREKRS
jgi:peptide/nickel transport system permease protein